MEEPFSINVGPLSGIGSLSLFVGKRLKSFSSIYSRGGRPAVIWDLSNVESRKMSIAGLTAFLAIAHRMKHFTGQPQSAAIRWDPEVFSFWKDISFLKLVDELGIIRWPEGMIGGFVPGKTNPDTKIVFFPLPPDVPDHRDLDEWKSWKDQRRWDIKRQLDMYCGDIFKAKREWSEYQEGILSKLKERVLLASAELVVNSFIHGKASAFVGLQRSYTGISVSVCDAGVGFLTSFAIGLGRQKIKRLPESEIEAILLGSICNVREFGLRDTIRDILNNYGWVIVCSSEAEIRWGNLLWNRALDQTMQTDDRKVFLKSSIDNILGEPIKGRMEDYDLDKGFYRIREVGLRGARISFEIPFEPLTKH